MATARVATTILRLLPVFVYSSQTCGDRACHPERSEGSGSTDGEILRCPFAALRASAHQDDSQHISPVRFREAFSPNICIVVATLAVAIPSCRIAELPSRQSIVNLAYYA